VGDEAAVTGAAFYSLRSGGWRDYVTVLHLPYTAWHLSYVCFGWAASPRVFVDRLVLLLIAFFLAVGVGAHVLDELNGKPLGTAIPDRVLALMALASIGTAVSIGVVEAMRTTLLLLLFVGFGGFIVVAYNLELFGGRFHSDLWFALAWGAFPAITATYSNTFEISAPGLLVTLACTLLSLAQRTLSTPVRELRRRVVSVTGTIELADGSRKAVDGAYLKAPPERALKMLSAALPLLGAAFVVLRLTR
jgi:hypothetical protein